MFPYKFVDPRDETNNNNFSPWKQDFYSVFVFRFPLLPMRRDSQELRPFVWQSLTSPSWTNFWQPQCRGPVCLAGGELGKCRATDLEGHLTSPQGGKSYCRTTSILSPESMVVLLCVSKIWANEMISREQNITDLIKTSHSTILISIVIDINIQHAPVTRIPE